MGKIVFDRMWNLPAYTPQQKRELKALVKDSILDWRFDKTSFYGFGVMAEYVRNYTDGREPVILQSMTVSPGTNGAKFNDKEFNAFKSKVLSARENFEELEYCPYCNIQHEQFLMRFTWCVIQGEPEKGQQPPNKQLASGKVGQ